ncbi:ComEC/Rec2 family competence protein [Nocardioides sp.]|uniref:ComEC/Rec2 family competence protein n=1 Tax=Nocardioides sp. TaxID=35761 RepID=UPI003D10318D
MTPSEEASGEPTVDLRMPLLAVAAWAGALLALLAPHSMVVPVVLAGVAALAWWWARTGIRGTAVLGACGVVALGVGGGAGLRAHAIATSPVAVLASQSAVVHARLTVTSDPVLTHGRFADQVLFRGRVEQVTGRGFSQGSQVPVLVIAPSQWEDTSLGSRVEVLGRLTPAEDRQLGGILAVRGEPDLVTGPGVTWRAAGALRTAIREAAKAGPSRGEVLVPALVDGDDAQLPETVATDFRTTGLTHLLAVSGTNLTLVVGFVLTLARWCGVRGRWQVLVAGLGIAGFVLLARTEPSVVRAAAMGAVGLLAMASNGRERGSRALAVAVVVLLLFDPWLATSTGFVLSVLATAGILFLAPGWRDALAAWMPAPLAEAIAVPFAAQLACTPVVAAISGQISLVAVVTNLLAAPAVGPATILGLLAGVLGLLVTPLGRALGWVAAWSAEWIVEVAERGAALPVPAVGWGTGAMALTLLTVGCLLCAVILPRLLRSRRTGTTALVLMLVTVLVPLPTPGWPPEGWVLVACDVGQGDALVLNAGHGQAVVVDAGPDPRLVDRCLDRLGVRGVPLVVLTHFHADHVDGLPGVLSGRTIGAVEVSALADPLPNVTQVRAEARGRALVRVAGYGQSRAVGDLTLQVLGPGPTMTRSAAGEGDGSGPNDASVVLLVEVAGVRILLLGDVEPPAQQALAAAWPGLRVDVLKVPHHGSRHQDLDWLLSLGARVGVVSVGADNTYGHPSTETLGPLAAAGLEIARTDQEGDIAITVRDGVLRVTHRG